MAQDVLERRQEHQHRGVEEILRENGGQGQSGGRWRGGQAISYAIQAGLVAVPPLAVLRRDERFCWQRRHRWFPDGGRHRLPLHGGRLAAAARVYFCRW